MKKLLLFILLMASPVWAVDVTQVEGPQGIFGAEGVTEGSDFGFGNITGNRIDARTGVFDNMTAGITYFNSSGPFYMQSDLSGTPIFSVADGLVQSRGTAGGFMSIDPSGSISTFKCQQNNCRLQVDNPNKILNLNQLSGFTVNGSYLTITGKATHSSGTYNHILINPTFNGSGTESHISLFINSTTVSSGSGQSSHILASDNNIINFRVDKQTGTVDTKGGLRVAYRNLSSISETLTEADHTIFCLPNDNAVTINFPTALQVDSSNIFEIKYVDLGSTNKCYLDGFGGETIDGFAIYSGLDTYREAVRIQGDGSNFWILGGV